MAVIKKIMAKKGTYMKDGQEKNAYMQCGVMMENENGVSIKLDALPTQFDGWLSLWDLDTKRSEQGKPDYQQGNPQPQDFTNDDIPF